jgi:hypothetical protein
MSLSSVIYSEGTIEEFVVQTLQDSLDRNYEQIGTILHIRFNPAEVVAQPGQPFPVHGYCQLVRRKPAPVIRAWLRIEAHLSQWHPINGSATNCEDDFSQWRDSCPSGHILIKMFPVPIKYLTCLDQSYESPKSYVNHNGSIELTLFNLSESESPENSLNQGNCRRKINLSNVNSSGIAVEQTPLSLAQSACSYRTGRVKRKPHRGVAVARYLGQEFDKAGEIDCVDDGSSPGCGGGGVESITACMLSIH